MKKGTYIRIILGILIVVGIVGVISFWRFLGAENLKENLLGEWYYVENTRCSVLRVSKSSLELVYDISDPYCSPREQKIEFVDNDTLKVFTERLYDNDIEEEFTLIFNEDKTNVKFDPPIISEGYRGVWHNGKPSNKILSEVNNNKAREEAEKIDAEKKKILKAFSDPKFHYKDLAVIDTSCSTGKDIYVKFKIYNKGSKLIEKANVRIDIYRGCYVDHCRTLEYSVGPVYSNGVTEFEIKGGWANPDIYGKDQGLTCRVGIVSYDEY